MGRNNSSLKHQLHERMESMTCFGESKHEAKKEYRQHQEDRGEKWNPAKATGIFSHKTYQAYQQTTKEFSAWLKSEHPEIKKIDHIEKSHIGEYLSFRDHEGKSPWTISKDMSALNKVLNLDVSKREFGLSQRSYKEVTRSRGEKAHDKEVKISKYADQVNFAKGTGCRRESVLKVTSAHLIRDERGTVVAVWFKEKGGREREAAVLKEYQERITSIAAGKNDDKPMFDKYPSRIDNHAYRREYALARYEELADQKGDSINSDSRGYDKECILQVSKDLGHNRESVVLEHYLPRK